MQVDVFGDREMGDISGSDGEDPQVAGEEGERGRRDSGSRHAAATWAL